MFSHHKAVAHLGGLLLGLLDDADELVGKTHLLALAGNLGRVVNGILRGACKLSRVGTDALDDHGDIALAGTEQGGQQVNRLHRAGLRGLHQTFYMLKRIGIDDFGLRNFFIQRNQRGPGIRPIRVVIIIIVG